MAEPSYQELLAENRRLKAENDRLRKRVEALEQQLQKLAEALEKSLRAEKRQAAPFSKGEPEAEPRRPGRKPGAAYGHKAHRQPPAPVQIDEHYKAPLPDSCPTCGGSLEETVVASRYQTEIPRKPIHREFRVHLGFCTKCGQSHQGRHPLQTSDALGAAAAQLGPDAQAAAVVLNKQAGLSHGKIVRVFRDLFGIVISRGGVAQAILRAARRRGSFHPSDSGDRDRRDDRVGNGPRAATLRFNVAPTTQVRLVREGAPVPGMRELVMMRWGLIPSWAKDAKIGASTIHARGDTVATKPAFRSAC